MKKIIVSIVLLGIGFCGGWYVGYTRPNAKTDREVRQQMHELELDDSMAAIYAVNVIPLIDSGDVQKAITRLAVPIGSWFRRYADNVGTDEGRICLRTKIEQLASSNQIVAAEIHRKD